MDVWRNSPVSGDLKEVPGIGPSAIEKLAKDDMNDVYRITNTYQLIGVYLLMKGPDVDGEEVTVTQLNHKFWYFLKSKGITAHRSGIVLALNSKVSSFMPNLNDADAEEENEEEDDDE